MCRHYRFVSGHGFSRAETASKPSGFSPCTRTIIPKMPSRETNVHYQLPRARTYDLPMSRPSRNSNAHYILSTSRTFFVTTETAAGKSLLESDRNARLFIDVLRHYVKERI
jgi:hypothetical protein